MKAIIPLAGAGTQLKPHTFTQPKALIPIAGKTILRFIVDQLYEGGIHEYIFIIGYLGDKIKDYVQKTYPHLKSHFIQQQELLGTGHAIELSRTIVGDDEIFVVMGDTICEFNIREVLSSNENLLGIKKVEDPRLFGVAVLDKDDNIEQLVEKPIIPTSNHALVGLYKIKNTALLFECLEEIFIKNIKNNGQYNLTDALECMIKKGAKFKAFKVRNWYDCGKKETLLESNSILFKKNGTTIINNQQFEGTIIINPVFIAEDCNIKNSIIGPNVSIGPNTEIKNSVINDSLIGSHSHINDAVLTNSIIGSDAVVNGLKRSLNIGDNTAIDFG